MLKTRTSNNFYRKTFFEWQQISHHKMETKRKWQIFQALKEKNHQLVVIYLQKISFRNERKIKIFSDEVKVREFVASRCTLN